MKVRELFWVNLLKFVLKWKTIPISRMDSIGQGKIRNFRTNLCAFGPKTKKNLRLFHQNLYGKLTFFTFFTESFLDFRLFSESLYICKISPDFYNNYSDFGRGTVLRSQHPTLLVLSFESIHYSPALNNPVLYLLPQKIVFTLKNIIRGVDSGMPLPQNDYHEPPAGISVRQLIVYEILRGFAVLENEADLHKFPYFSRPKYPFQGNI